MQIIIFNWDLKARFTLMISITVQWNKYEGEMGNTVSSPNGPIYDRQTFPRTDRENKLLPKCSSLDRNDQSNQKNGNQENSRMLFLMYLINRTWNVVGGKRWVECTWTWSWKSKTEKRQKEIIHFTFIATLTRSFDCSSFFFRSSNIKVSKFYSDDDINNTKFVEDGNDDNYSCNNGSECSYCSCGYCEDETCRIDGNYSICERWVRKFETQS